MLALGALGACNPSWEGRLTTFSPNPLHPIEFISVFPAVRSADGTYERQCTTTDLDGNAVTVDSLLFSITLLGTDPNTDDVDNSIRPGDLVKKSATERNEVAVGDTVTESNFEVEISCLETYPDPDLTGAADCQLGKSVPKASPQKLDYRSYYDPSSPTLRPPSSEKDSMAIAFLIDQSGSMKGFVTPEDGYEATVASPWEGGDFKSRASDPDSYRTSAVKSFVSLLNVNDRTGVFQFGEVVGANAKIVCDLSTDKDEATRRRDCFGVNRQAVFGCSADEIAQGCQLKGTDFTKLQISARGRTPLWAAVEDVYNFMRNDVDTRVRHIVVVTDGPDTCHPDSPDYMPTLRQYKGNKYIEFQQDNACSTVSFLQFLATLEADLKNADGQALATNLVPVHISFIQFQSMGYHDRDPRQQEVACRTGGHYIFINSGDFEKETTGESPLRQALVLQAVPRLRSAMAGSWTLAVDVPDLALGRLPLGSEMAVGGQISMFAGAVTPNAQFDLRVGYVESAATGAGIPRLDMRGSFRIPCGAGDSCSWYGGAGDCGAVACRAGDAVCMPSFVEDQTSCGTGGACCWGECLTPASECLTFDALCNPVNKADDTTCSAGVCCGGVCQATCP